MKQFFETIFGVFLILVVVFLSAQGVLTNSTISTAREYHETVIEKIENSGLDEAYINKLVEYTNNNTNYTLTVIPVEGYEETKSYHVQIKYPVKTLAYYLFGGKSSGGTATIDGFASVGKANKDITASDTEKHGNIKNTAIIGSGITATLYSDGFLIIDGNGTITETLDIQKTSVTHIVITGEVSIPDTYFKDYKRVKVVYLGNCISIGSRAFENNVSLVDIVIPYSVKNIETGAFNGCKNLEYIYIDQFAGEITLDDEIINNDCTAFKNIIYLY